MYKYILLSIYPKINHNNIQKIYYENKYNIVINNIIKQLPNIYNIEYTICILHIHNKKKYYFNISPIKYNNKFTNKIKLLKNMTSIISKEKYKKIHKQLKNNNSKIFHDGGDYTLSEVDLLVDKNIKENDIIIDKSKNKENDIIIDKSKKSKKSKKNININTNNNTNNCKNDTIYGPIVMNVPQNIYPNYNYQNLINSYNKATELEKEKEKQKTKLTPYICNITIYLSQQSRDDFKNDDDVHCNALKYSLKDFIERKINIYNNTNFSNNYSNSDIFTFSSGIICRIDLTLINIQNDGLNMSVKVFFINQLYCLKFQEYYRDNYDKIRELIDMNWRSTKNAWVLKLTNEMEFKKSINELKNIKSASIIIIIKYNMQNYVFKLNEEQFSIDISIDKNKNQNIKEKIINNLKINNIIITKECLLDNDSYRYIIDTKIYYLVYFIYKGNKQINDSDSSKYVSCNDKSCTELFITLDKQMSEMINNLINKDINIPFKISISDEDELSLI